MDLIQCYIGVDNIVKRTYIVYILMLNAFTTEDGLKLIFSMDGDGRLIVEFANG